MIWWSWTQEIGVDMVARRHKFYLAFFSKFTKRRQYDTLRLCQNCKVGLFEIDINRRNAQEYISGYNTNYL
jgi:hypothetical protein